VTDALKSALRRAELPKVRVDDLRHTAATLQLEWGSHPKVVHEMLGHSTISITLDLYSHVAPAMHKEAVKRFGRLF
jgi:integrase